MIDAMLVVLLNNPLLWALFLCGLYTTLMIRTFDRMREREAVYVAFINDVFRQRLDACQLCAFHAFALKVGYPLRRQEVPRHTCPDMVTIFHMERIH